jgi:hypothetical protein
VLESLTFPELIALSSPDGPGASECTESDIVKALMVGKGLIAYAAAHLTSTRGIAISRSQLAARVEKSPTLRLARAVAEEISWREALKKSAALGVVPSAGTEAADEGRCKTDKIDAGAEARVNETIVSTPESSSSKRLSRAGGWGLAPLCGARTRGARGGRPCRNPPEPGRARCKFHGGKSTGPTTAAGRARIAAAQRARWRTPHASP